MGPVRKYKVNHNGFDTVMKLNDEDVKAFPGARPVDESTEEREGPQAGQKPEAKTRTASDKARRTASDKSNG